MILYLSLIPIVCFIAYMTNNDNYINDHNKVICIKFSRKEKLVGILIFLILFLISAIRYNVGVDYIGYITLYERIKYSYDVHSEIGFNIIVKLIQKTFDSTIVMFAVFALFTIGLMLKGIFEQSKNYVLSLFLFMSLGYYYLTFNSIRYYLALALAFYTIRYLMTKNYIKFILIILIAACFHKTVLIVIPVYLFAMLKSKRLSYIILIFGAFSLIIFRHPIRMIAFSFYQYYLGSVYDGGSASVFNIIKAVMVTIMCLIFYKKISGNKILEFYFILNLIALILYVCCSWIPELSRIGFYFNFGNIILIPNLIKELKFRVNRRIINGLVIVGFSGYILLMLYQSSSPTIQLLPYQTWINF